MTPSLVRKWSKTVVLVEDVEQLTTIENSRITRAPQRREWEKARMLSCDCKRKKGYDEDS